MGINLYYAKGYVDPTAYEALKNIEQDKKKTFERIRTLEKSIQMHIFKCYYGGRTSWLKGGA